MSDRLKFVLQPARMILILTLLVASVGVFVPETSAIAATSHKPSSGEELSGVFSYSVIQRDFRRLKILYVRHKDKVQPLSKGLNVLLNNYRTLQNRGNKKWVEMRVLYYDYNSYYQAAISHRYEVELLLANHYGFDSKGKIINDPMGKYTVSKLRGAVVQMISDINNANATLRQGKRLMTANAVPDKKPNK
jgi:hypothetical protein